MNTQQPGWTPDYPEGDARADPGRGGKRAAARTPGSTPRSDHQGGPPPAMGRKAPRGLEQDFGYADNQEGEAYQQRQYYNTTVLEADLYEQTYLEVYPSQAVTNPPSKDMSYVSPGKVMHEIRLKGMANGIHHSKFSRNGATDVIDEARKRRSKPAAR